MWERARVDGKRGRHPRVLYYHTGDHFGQACVPRLLPIGVYHSYPFGNIDRGTRVYSISCQPFPKEIAEPQVTDNANFATISPEDTDPYGQQTTLCARSAGSDSF